MYFHVASAAYALKKAERIEFGGNFSKLNVALPIPCTSAAGSRVNQAHNAASSCSSHSETMPTTYAARSVTTPETRNYSRMRRKNVGILPPHSCMLVPLLPCIFPRFRQDGGGKTKEKNNFTETSLHLALRHRLQREFYGKSSV